MTQWTAGQDGGVMGGAPGARGGGGGGGGGGAPELMWYLRVLRDHVRGATLVFVAVVAAVAIGTILQTPTYRATGMIEIRRPADEVVSVDALFQAPRISSQYLETQYKLLQSPPVLRRVVNELGWAPTPAQAADSGAAGQESVDPLVRWLQGALLVDPIRGSHLVRVSFDDADPETAARVVNAALKSYIDLRVEAASSGVDRIAMQVDSSRVKLADAEERLHGYVRQHELFFLESPSGEAENIVHERLRRLQQHLTEAEADIHARAAVYDQVRTAGADATNSALIQSLMVRISDLRAEHARLRATFTDEHPAMRQIQQQLDELERALAAERRRITANLGSDYQAALRHRDLLLRTFEEQKALVDGLTDKMAEYRILKRDVDSHQQLYALLKQKLEEAEVSAALAATEFGVIDPAVPPEVPIRPAPRRNLPLGVIAGLILAVGFAFVREVTDPRIKRLEEVDSLSTVPVLGLIPSAGALPNAYRRTGLSEAFGSLRTSVLFYGSGEAPPSMQVTSARPGEGKTTVSVNLAISLARLGKRVLLVDGDVRRPAVARNLGIAGEPGLVEYLSGQMDWQALVVPGPVSGLAVLPAGHPPHSPAELLSSARMRILIEQAEAAYDHVVVDSPAVSINAADSRILSLLVRGVVMVLRSGATPRDVVQRVLRDTPNLIGMVLNDCPRRDLPAYYGAYSPASAEMED